MFELMINSVFLIPPGSGPKADPVIFGVAEGLARLFPLPESASSGPCIGSADERTVASAEGKRLSSGEVVEG